MLKKTDRVAASVKDNKTDAHGLDPHYLGFFECFNRGEYYEAHEVLEKLWLPSRSGPDGDFYKGLIQLAGAFVHLQKGRPQPAVSLLKLARANLQKYPLHHHRLSLAVVLQLIESWLRHLEAVGSSPNPADTEHRPTLTLE